MEAVLDAVDITETFKKRKRSDEDDGPAENGEEKEEKKLKVENNTKIDESVLVESIETIEIPLAFTNHATEIGLEDSRDWNEEYQQLIDKAKTFTVFREWVEEHGKVQEALQKLYQEFLQVAEQQAKQIIEETELPTDKKTIKPLPALPADPDNPQYLRFSSRNILFKVPVAEFRIQAEEKMANELRGTSTLIGTQVEGGGIYFPMKTIVDYKGHRILAISIIQSLSLDKLEPVRADAVGLGVSPLPESYCEVIRQLAERANFKHQVIHFHGELFHPVSLEGRFAGDGRFYFTSLDFSDILPQIGQIEDSSSSVHQLRPELVAMNPTPLNSPAFNKYSLGSAEDDKLELEEAAKSLRNDLIPSCATFLQTRIEQRREQVITESEPKIFQDPGSSFSVQEIVHSWGINTRYIGLVQANLTSESFSKGVMSIEMIARSLKTKLREAWREISGEDACKAEAGRLVGLLFQKSEEAKHFRDQIVHLMQTKFFYAPLQSNGNGVDNSSLQALLGQHYVPLLPRFLRRLQDLCGIVLSQASLEEINKLGDAQSEAVSFEVIQLKARTKRMTISSISNPTTGSLSFKQQVEIKVQQQGVLDKPDLFPIHLRAAREFGWELQYWAARNANELETQQLLDRAVRCYRTLLSAQPNNLSIAARLLYCYISRSAWSSTVDEQRQHLMLIQQFTRSCIDELKRQKPHLAKSELLIIGMNLLDGGVKLQNIDIVLSATQYLIKLPFVHSNMAMGMLYLQQTIFRIERKLRESFPQQLQVDFLIRSREAITNLMFTVEPSNYLGYLSYFATIRSEIEYNEESGHAKSKEFADRLVNLWTGKITLYLGRKEHDVAVLQALGYSLHILQLQRENDHLLYDLAARCFEQALQYEPQKISALLAYGETCMDIVGDNYSMLRHAVGLFKRCLQSKELPSNPHMIQRIAHDLLNALVNPWNFFQNSADAIQEFMGVADNLVASLENPDHSLYMTLGHGYSLIARLDVDQRLFYTHKQHLALEQAFKIAEKEDAIRKAREQTDGRDLQRTKSPLPDILELWGYVQEQLADACAALGETSSQHKWLLSAIKKYQDAVAQDPMNAGLCFKLGSAYASWLKAKVESGSQENLSLDNVWLRNAEMAWNRAVACNPYLSDVYKQWADLYAFMQTKTTDRSLKSKLGQKFHEKQELQSKAELLSVQMMYTYEMAQ